MLLGALAEVGVTPEAFVAPLIEGSLWQDSALRSTDGQLCIDAHLWKDGLRCAIRIGRESWYHHPAGELHLFHVVLPATAMALSSVSAATIIGDRLFADPAIRITAIRQLGADDPGMGTLIALDMPLIDVRADPVV